MRVSWDRAKNLANRKKHGLSFEDAARLFASGVNYLVVFDEIQSVEEDRFIAIGPIRSGLVVIVWVRKTTMSSGSSAPDGRPSESASCTDPTWGARHD